GTHGLVPPQWEMATALGSARKRGNERESTPSSMPVAVNGDARVARDGSGHHTGRAANAVSCRQGVRAGRLQDLPDREPPKGAYGEARLLPRGERKDPLHALSPLPGPVSPGRVA